MGRRLFRLFCPVTVAATVALGLAPAPAAADPLPGPPSTAVATIRSAATVADVRRQLDDLHRQAEQASERYNAAGERAAAAQVRLREVQAQLAARHGELTALRGVVGKIAAATYRSGAADPALLLVAAKSPEDFLRQASALAQLSARQNTALRRMTEMQRQQGKDRADIQSQVRVLVDSRDEVERERVVIEQRLVEAEAVLNRLEADERARMEAEDRAAAARAAAEAQAQRDRVDRSAAASRSRSASTPPQGAGSVPVSATSDRAARAVDVAFAQLGKPYRYGATGPGAFDCSGLTGYAWRAAGIGLPRTSTGQYAAGRKVSRGSLQPGDLVYYYSPISHVGIYIGGGQIIHASRSGRPVSVAPVNSMPFAGATRP